LEEKAKLEANAKILKKQLKETAELTKKMAATGTDLWKRITDISANYDRKITEATKKGKHAEARNLMNEKNALIEAANKNTRDRQRGIATKLTKTQQEAVNSYKAAEAKEKAQKKLIEKTSSSFGSEKVTIPDNYVPPELVKGVLTINFGASVGIHQADIVPLYDIACVKHSDEKSKLLQVLGNLEANIKSGSFPFNDTAAVELSKKEDFIAYWANLREYCQKLTDGLIPKDRALRSFFKTKFNSFIMNQIKLVNVTENAHVTGVALFFDQLAQWATTRDKSRCSCDDITDLINTGIAPDLTKFPDAKKSKIILPELMKMVGARCVQRYPTQCKLPTTKGVKALEAELEEDGESLDMMARIMSDNLQDLAE
jgi:hypothetical protein